MDTVKHRILGHQTWPEGGVQQENVKIAHRQGVFDRNVNRLSYLVDDYKWHDDINIRIFAKRNCMKVKR